MRSFFAKFFTPFPQETHKTTLPFLLVVMACCLAGLIACSSTKAVKQAKTKAPAPVHASLISTGPDEVKKKLGEPTEVSRTQEDHILWVYVPRLKIFPNDKGTIYVEFENNKVIKVFKIE